MLARPICQAQEIRVEGKICLPYGICDRVPVFEDGALLHTLLLNVKFILLAKAARSLHHFSRCAKDHAKGSRTLVPSRRVTITFLI